MSEEKDIIGIYEGKDGRRFWWSGGTWLMPGEKVAVIYPKEEKKGYTIFDTNLDGGDTKSIRCHRCGRTSYNQNDVKNRYCGFCHVFHEEKGQE